MGGSSRAQLRASNLVAAALKSGKLVRKPCEVCGKEPADAHHDDYAAPLKVRWLCRSHHQEFHRTTTVDPGGEPVSIAMRATLTPSEWTALRKLAIDLGRPLQDVIADALRKSRVTAQALKDAA